MLTTTTPRAVETHGVTETRAFSMKASGKAFKVLIDGLYSDKILAVIRELWTNAYDSHVEAGQEDVFESHLPTQFEPYFSVRDLGTGMSHETIMGLYTTVFESSKENTNAQVGKLGLGSKSPFAYTDTFTVMAWDGTEVRMYSAYIGTDHIPQLAMMGTEPSDEPRGIEISFPVKTEDVKAFEVAALHVMRGFDYPPYIRGNDVRKLRSTPEKILEGDGWVIFKPERGDAFSAAARQGCVLYPIDANAVGSLTDVERSILRSALVIDFAIGDLEINASREGLGYDEPTKANIKARIKVVAQEIVAKYQAEIDACESRWHAARYLGKMCRDIDVSVVATLLRNLIKWRGKEIGVTVEIHNFIDKHASSIRVMPLEIHKLGAVYSKNTVKFDHNPYNRVDLETTALIFENVQDNLSFPMSRIRHWWAHLRADGTQYKDALWIKYSGTQRQDVLRFLIHMGRPEHFLLKDMARPPVAKGESTRRRVKMKVMRNGNWQETDIEETDDIIYVTMERNDVTYGPSTSHSASSIQTLQTYAIKTGALPEGTKVIGIPKTHMNVLARNEHWRTLHSVVEQFLDNTFVEKDSKAYQLAFAVMQEFDGDMEKWFNETKDSDFYPCEPNFALGLHKMYHQYKATKKKHEAYADLNRLNDRHGRHTKSPSDGQAMLKFHTLMTGFKNAYPLLRNFPGYGNHINKDVLLDYVNHIDKTANDLIVEQDEAA